MVVVAILRRRLRQGKSHEDFRRAWYHTVGFGVANRMLTVLDAADPRQIIVIGLTETSAEEVGKLIAIDVAERENNSLDEVVEPQVERSFGVLIAEDDFSASGAVDYRPAGVNGVQTDVAKVATDIEQGAALVARLQGGGSRAEL
jgi:hypothetical protein